MEVNLKARPNRATGKGPSRALRREGLLPAVVYGQGMSPMAVAVDRRELQHALSTEAGKNVLINLEIEGEKKPHLTLARELQRDPVRQELLHVDFLAIDPTKEIEATVPVSLVGEAPAVGMGLIIEHHAVSVVVATLPTTVPSVIEGSLDSLVEVGDSIKAADLVLPENVRLVTDPDESIAVVTPPPVLEVPEEAPAEGEEAPAEGEEPAAVAEEGGEAPAKPTAEGVAESAVAESG